MHSIRCTARALRELAVDEIKYSMEKHTYDDWYTYIKNKLVSKYGEGYIELQQELATELSRKPKKIVIRLSNIYNNMKMPQATFLSALLHVIAAGFWYLISK